MASPLAILARVSLLLLLFQSSSAQLTTTVYQTSCPGVYKVVKDGIRYAISAENRIGASLVRLFFHDCFVNGCDGSVLLDDTPNFLGEKTSPPNNNSMRGFEVIDKIKANVEKLCPGVVSCADILAIAARDSVVTLGGPNWEVKVGRRDARSASFNDSTDALPPAIFNLSQLISSFQDQGLSVRDMVALSGAHTIGKARCTSFRDHVYNGSNIDQTFAKTRQANCPRITPRGDDNLAPLDRRTTRIFDNSYFKNLVEKKGLLPSDQELFNGASTDSIVLSYSRDTQVFFADFVAAMIKMGDRSPRPGTQLEIRRNCRRLN